MLFGCISCTATPEISSLSKNINNIACVARPPSRFLWLLNNMIKSKPTKETLFPHLDKKHGVFNMQNNLLCYIVNN